MPSIDLPRDELERYRPELSPPDDFGAFWETTLAEVRARPLELSRTRADVPGTFVDAYDLSFRGFADSPVNGWYVRPRFTSSERLPLIVVYHGYGGGRGRVFDYAPWLLLGCAVLSMDTRGQGGATGDPRGYEGPSVTGWLTKGGLEPSGYYYRAVYADAVRLLDVALSFDDIDPERIAVTGASQGGALSLVAAGLSPQVSLVMPDVPFLCHIRRGVDLAQRGPYGEVADYLRRYPERLEPLFTTLNYFDAVHFAARVTAPSRWSVGLWDDICPPSTIYAAYHACGSTSAPDQQPPDQQPPDKQLDVYPYNNHEGGGTAQRDRQLAYVADRFGF